MTAWSEVHSGSVQGSCTMKSPQYRLALYYLLEKSDVKVTKAYLGSQVESIGNETEGKWEFSILIRWLVLCVTKLLKIIPEVLKHFDGRTKGPPLGHSLWLMSHAIIIPYIIHRLHHRQNGGPAPIMCSSYGIVRVIP